MERSANATMASASHAAVERALPVNRIPSVAVAFARTPTVSAPIRDAGFRRSGRLRIVSCSAGRRDRLRRFQGKESIFAVSSQQSACGSEFLAFGRRVVAMTWTGDHSERQVTFRQFIGEALPDCSKVPMAATEGYNYG